MKRIALASKLKPVCLNTSRYSITGLENTQHLIINHQKNMKKLYSNNQHDFFKCPFFCCKINLSTSTDKRVRQLERELHSVELEREILKKALAIFSKVPR